MSMAIEKQSGISHKLNWRGLSLSKTAINGLIGFGHVKTRTLDKRDNGYTGIFVMFSKNSITSVYYDISRKRVGVWYVRGDKS